MKRKNKNRDEPGSSSLYSNKGAQESREPCEICGSAGIAGLMMVCFKCRKTREHTYCARVFLPSVPPIWLCEVCRSSSRILFLSDAADDLMGAETSAADCSSDPKNSQNSREEDPETAKLRTNNVEEVVDAGISSPVTLQASTSDSRCEISVNVSSAIHSPSQPYTSPGAKETSSVLNDTYQDKEQRQPSQAFPKKPRTLRLMGRHVSQSHQDLVSSLDQSLTKMPHRSVNQERLS